MLFIYFRTHARTHAQFLVHLMKKDWQEAHKLCRFILMYEPMNQVAVEFLPLIQHKLENGDDDDSSSDDDQDSDDDNDDDDDDDDNEEDSDDDDDDDDDDDSDEDDDDNEAETKKQPADAAAAAAATAANQIRTVELSTVIESLKLKK